MKKHLLTFLAIFVAGFFGTTVFAADYTLFEDASVPSYALPISYFHTTYMGSITQQIYLAEELIDAGASSTGGDINAITFYYTAKAGSTASAFERDIKIWLMAVPNTTDEYPISTVPWSSGSGNDYLSNFQYDSDTKKAGVEVFSGKLSTAQVTSSNPINFNTDIKSVTLDLSRNFPWDGTSNIVMTVADVSNESGSSANLRFLIASTVDGNGAHPRFVYTKWSSLPLSHLSWVTDGFSTSTYGEIYPNNTTNASYKTESGQKTQRSYVNKITFSISTIVAPSTPTGLAASDASTNSITLSWNAASSATAYDLQYKDGETWKDLASDIDETSYTWTGRDANTSYEVRVRASNSAGKSDWSDAVSVSTEPEFIYKEITFEKWSSTTSMPTSGNYYLANDVELSGNVSPSGNLNLCLNGHTVLTSSNCIIVPDGVTFAIFDNEGSGVIRGAYPGEFANSGLISVKNGGTLKIGEGGIVNLADDANDYNLAIDNKGTLLLSGAPTISGVKADIYLGTSKVITIESGKPLTNSTPYTVDAVGQVITSGWVNMGGANPANFFASAKSGYPAVVLDGGEAKLVAAISLSDTQDNSSIITNGANQSTPIVVTMTRSFTSASYNTVCLPFDLTDAQLQAVFGSGYDLQSFQGAEFDEETGETLLLNFSKVTTLSAGVPYLIQPSINVLNPTFNGVTIPSGHTATPAAQISTHIDFQGVYSPRNVGNGKNILFVGANNELFWNNNTSGELKGFRAFFTAKGSAAKAVKARIVKKDNVATAIDHVQEDDMPCKKILHNGQLFILHKGTKYNVQGQMVK